MALLGGSDSKSSSYQSQVGSQTQLGDPISISLTGGKSSHRVSIRQTDYGAINKAFDLADKVLVSQNDFAVDTLEAAKQVSADIIEAGQQSAGTTERITAALETFIDDQNNPEKNNQMILILGSVGILAVMIWKGKK